MTRLYVDGPTVIRAVRAAVANLEKHVDEVDALNVFPVPDGDTGSNMLATMRAALAEAERLPAEERDLVSVADALSRGALTGARGNSGVILSQIIRGMTHRADGRRRANGVDLAAGLRRGSEVAYEAVLTPVEGTMLTVIRDAAEAAEAAAGRQPHVEAVLADVISAAASSVQRTPMLLPVLEDAGVVDSGGQGLYRILEGIMQVAPGDTAVAARERGGTTPGAALPFAHVERGAHAEHGYETEYLVTADGARVIDVASLRTAVQAIGDSVVVAGDGRLVRVHVHGARPDLAVAAGLAWGRLSGVSIRDLDDQVAHLAHGSFDAHGSSDAHESAAAVRSPLAQEGEGTDHADGPGRPPAADQAAPAERAMRTIHARTTAHPAPAVALVAVAEADGITHILASLGARVVRPGHGTRPSVGEILEGILAAGSAHVIVLPNDRDAVLAARHAAEQAPLVEVTVIPTRNAAEGIAAALAFDAGRPPAESAARMTAEAGSLRSATLTTAARDSLIDGVAITRGQVIALDAERRLLACADDLAEALIRALMQLGEFQLITAYHGRQLDADMLTALRQRVAAHGFAAELELLPGGQRHDLLLVAVE